MKKRILFFIAGSSPTESDLAKAKKLGTRMFRNAGQIQEGNNLEPCDAVAGCAPDAYVEAFGLAEDGARPAAPEPAKAPPLEKPAPTVASETKEEVKEPPQEVAPVDLQRSAEDEGAKGATSAQLREALDQLGIKYASNTPKPELLALFLNRP